MVPVEILNQQLPAVQVQDVSDETENVSSSQNGHAQVPS